MKKEKFILKPTHGKQFSVLRSSSLLSLPIVKKDSKESIKAFEKEFESIAEEALVQVIQSPIVKRDKSADHVNDFYPNKDRASMIYRERISQLEQDLANLRKDYIKILDEKVKIEKDIIEFRRKNKQLEENKASDAEKISILEDIDKKYHIQEPKYLEATNKIVELNKKLVDLVDKIAKDNEENVKKSKIYEERIQRLIKENVTYKNELNYRDEYCMGLKQEINQLKLLPKDHFEKSAAKALSRDKTKIDNTKEKWNEIEKQNISKAYEECDTKYKNLKFWTQCLCNLIKSQQFTEASLFVQEINHEKDEALLVIHSKSSTETSLPHNSAAGNDAEIKELQRVIASLESKIEQLEIKLSLTQDTKDFLNYMQCQSAIIEDYLNEDSEISQINSSIFSF